MNFNSHIAEALMSERKRLGLSQAAAAAECGVSREMWGRYERGLATPGAEVISRFVLAGADAIFLMTGHVQPSSSVDPDLAVENAIQLTPEEHALLHNYRHCDPGEQKAIRATSTALAEQKGDYKPRKRSAG